MESSFSPREVVSELDKFIIGQKNAKKAVAVALRNRWRRKQLPEKLKEEILPKNILMVGPTGCGKTEISRRLAKLADAPFIKVEATKFTEVGYVGRDVEQIIRDLVEVSINKTKIKMGHEVRAHAEKNAEEKVLDALVGSKTSKETREGFRQKLRNGELNDKIIEIKVSNNSSFSLPTMDIPGMPGSQMGMINLGDVFGKSFSQPKKVKKLSVKDSHAHLLKEETEKLLDNEKIIKNAIENVEQNGIVFIDEIDKITSRSVKGGGADVSREGVQRDLLPLIEGTSVSTKHGVVNTDFVLFIASGAFHIAKPSDMLPELQGRLPIRVELESLSKKDFISILKEPENSLIKQYVGLLGTEKIELIFDDGGVEKIAELASEINQNIENIGARRLHTIMEKLLEDISYNASDIGPKKVDINKKYVEDHLEELIKSQDLSKFIL
ncbi:MAG: ATP-dependent protease ATPase subunit HslU [Alphaproteobacteria bacterium MarineAlpha5_Bin9]|nr:MAG: ATP-dependent protease ATPase subunit HslU [Alphaproteobacteria bacterium MarineAlpha5_Bin9]|tara:strand:+ start:496 stop:1812 length:1317 start_codon:yes stop_codon:yes gene_type:complete